MKVLHIFPSSYTGGSELCAIETIKALKSHAVNNYVIFPTEGLALSKVVNDVNEYTIIENSWWMSIFKWTWLFKLKIIRGYFLSSFRIKKYIQKNKIDIVVTHTIGIPTGALAAKLAGKPHLWYIHEYGDLDHGFIFSFGKKISFKLINLLSQKIFVNSEALMMHFQEYFPAKKLIKLNYAVDYPSFSPMQEKEKDTLKLCMVGRITSGKNQRVVIDALVHLKNEGILPHVTFVGTSNDAYLNLLKKDIVENELEKQVTFIGHSEEPWIHVQNAHAVIICSKMEAFGRVTIEAMKAGRIALVANTGAGKELVVDGVTGYLFDPDNLHDLANKIKIVWKMDNTAHITESAFSFATNNFNMKKHGEKLAEILNQVV